MEKKPQVDLDQFGKVLNDLATFRQAPDFVEIWKQALAALDRAHADGALSSEEQKATLKAYLYDFIGPLVFEETVLQVSDEASVRFNDAYARAEKAGVEIPDQVEMDVFIRMFLPHFKPTVERAKRKPRAGLAQKRIYDSSES